MTAFFYLNPQLKLKPPTQLTNIPQIDSWSLKVKQVECQFPRGLEGDLVGGQLLSYATYIYYNVKMQIVLLVCVPN